MPHSINPKVQHLHAPGVTYRKSAGQLFFQLFIGGTIDICVMVPLIFIHRRTNCIRHKAEAGGAPRRRVPSDRASTDLFKRSTQVPGEPVCSGCESRDRVQGTDEGATRQGRLSLNSFDAHRRFQRRALGAVPSES